MRTLTLVGFELAIGLVAVLLGWLCGVSVLDRLVVRGSDVVYGTLATVPMVILFVLLWRSRSTSLRRIRDTLTSDVVRLFRGVTVAGMAAVSAAAGLGEELLFRGLIQGGLADRIGNLPALVVASVAFGAAHPITTAYAAIAALIGGYLGWLFVATDSLAVPIAAHGLYDFVVLLFVTQRSAERRRERVLGDRPSRAEPPGGGT